MNTPFSAHQRRVLSPDRVAGVAAVVALAVVAAWLHVGFEGNITGLFRIGDAFPLSPLLDRSAVRVFGNEAGYDGQFFLTIALDPLLREPASRAALDVPAYRYRRILYPALGYVLALGCRPAVPWALLALNVTSVILIVRAVAAECERMAMPARSGLGVLAMPGIWVTLSLSTADLLASLFLALSLIAYARDRAARCALWLMLSCLTRETLLVMVAAFAAAAVSRRQWRQLGHLLWSGCPCLLWIAWVSKRFEGDLSSVRVADWFGAPAAGMADKIRAILHGGLSGRAIFDGASFLLLAAVFVALLAEAGILWRTRRALCLAAFAYAGIFALARLKLLGYYIDFYRVFIDPQWMLVMSARTGRGMAHRAVLAGAGLASAAYVIAYAAGMI